MYYSTYVLSVNRLLPDRFPPRKPSCASAAGTTAVKCRQLNPLKSKYELIKVKGAELSAADTPILLLYSLLRILRDRADLGGGINLTRHRRHGVVDPIHFHHPSLDPAHVADALICTAQEHIFHRKRYAGPLPGVSCFTIHLRLFARISRVTPAWAAVSK